MEPTPTCWCATKAQVASGWKSRPGNWRFIPVATRTAGQGDLPAEALGTNVSRKGCSNLTGRNGSEPWEGPERTVAEADPPNIRGRPMLDGVATVISIHLICRGNEDGMSGR